MRRLFFEGLALAVLAFALDQVSKLLLVDYMQALGKPLPVTGFFNMVMVWNRGVSFGLFSQHDAGLILSAASVLVCGILLVWMWRTPRRLTALALGLVIGGALGNALDRVHYGAVADFFDAYFGQWHWPAFNVADIFICAGVALLILESILEGRQTKETDAP